MSNSIPEGYSLVDLSINRYIGLDIK
jgi:hypothetical protein